jgi:hypothetical protein
MPARGWGRLIRYLQHHKTQTHPCIIKEAPGLHRSAADLDAHRDNLFSQQRPLDAFVDNYLSERHMSSPGPRLPAANNVFRDRSERPAQCDNEPYRRKT